MSDISIRHYYMVEDLKIIVYILAIISVSIVAYSLLKAYKRWTAHGEKIRANPESLIENLTLYSLLQLRIIRHRFPGLLHAMIFAGILWLLVMTVLRALDYYLGPFLTGNLWVVYKFLGNVAGAMVILGSSIAIARRYFGLTPNLPKDPSYYLVHFMFIVIVVTGFALDGFSAAAYRVGYESPLFDPLGYIFYVGARQLSFDELRAYYRVLWVVHLFLAMMAIALMPFTNLWHIIASNINIAFSRPGPPVAALRYYPDIEDRVGRGEPVGMFKLSSSTWKQRLDWDACTSCMRCTNACPAYSSGKPLDPRLVMVTLRDAMYSGKWDSKPWGDGGVDPQSIWSCVTCGACVYECPVLIHHVDSIVDVRKAMMSLGDESIPEGVLNSLTSMQQLGNPMGSSPTSREEWIGELRAKFGDDIIAVEGEHYDYLYWPGCATVYDPRVRSVGESLLEILREAGVKVAIIPDDACTGDPALRMGEELMFLEKASGALEALSKYSFNRLLVNCPHCYTAFKWEYRKYKDYFKARLEGKASILENLEVEHHTQLLDRLVKEGKLKPGVFKATVAYHDPCYLGRWNGVYEEPRNILSTVGKLRLLEMPRNRDRGFCCGGGGGQLFYEVRAGERISRVRSEEASKTLAEGPGDKVLAVACPYCNIMFRGEAEDYGFKVMDIVEVLRESLRKS